MKHDFTFYAPATLLLVILVTFRSNLSNFEMDPGNPKIIQKKFNIFFLIQKNSNKKSKILIKPQKIWKLSKMV